MTEQTDRIEEQVQEISDSINQPEQTGEVVIEPEIKKKKKKFNGKLVKRIVLTALALAVVGGTAFGLYQLFKPQEEIINTGFVTRGSIISSKKGTGVVTPKLSKDVMTSATGKVLNVYVTEGQKVNEGDPLFSVDSSSFNEKLQAKQDDLNERQKDINTIQENINNLTVKAPFTGKIIGVTAQKGDSAGGPIGTMFDDSNMKLTLYFSYAYENSIRTGQGVTISIPQSMSTVEGTVQEVQKIRKITPQGTVLFEVTIQMRNPGTLTKDMDATAVVHTPDGDAMPAESGKLSYNREQVINAKSSGEIIEMNAKDYYEFKEGQTLCVMKDDSLATQLVSAKEAYNSVKKDYDTLLEERSQYESYAPISGTVMSCALTEGMELTGSETNAMTIADLSVMVMDINVDEVDVGELQIGMQANLTAEGMDNNSDGSMMMGKYGMPADVQNAQPAEEMDGTEEQETGDMPAEEMPVQTDDGENMAVEGEMATDGIMPDGIADGMMEGDGMFAAPVTGILTYISLTGKSENGITTYPATITIDGSSGDIRPNRTMNYEIITKSKTDILLIPAAGAVYTDAGMVAYVKEDSVTANMTRVELPKEQQKKGFVAVAISVGDSDGNNVEVTEGLEEDVEVALVGTVQSQNDPYSDMIMVG